MALLVAPIAEAAESLFPARFIDGKRVIFLESGRVQVGVDLAWGGAIREIRFAGVNLINNFDGGRLAGVAFYDSDRLPVGAVPDDTGWNPSPSDKHNDENRPLEYRFANDVLYLKAHTFQWYPDNKGGLPGHPVVTDIIVETWIEFLGDGQTLHLRYKATNKGRDRHGAASQEFPFAYVRTPFNRFVSYTGNQPWHNESPTMVTVPTDRTGSALVVASEHWGGYVDRNDVGLVIWAPQNYPEFTYSWLYNAGPKENTTLYLLPRGFFGIDAGQSREIEAFVFAGKWQDARQRIYQLHKALAFDDVMPGFGTVDRLSPARLLSGHHTVNGWALDDRRLDRVEIRVDDHPVGIA